MKQITIPIDISPDLLVTLNESEIELKSHFQLAIAMMLFQQKKLTIGKATQLSGLTRYEFEKNLAQYNIPIVDFDITQLESDLKKIKDL